ncbi:MAG: hypothetical protein JNK53_08325, partial [Phycisphaerae bacterium]|nr:hypothetical protein [Phycisphaerae bacterium]
AQACLRSGARQDLNERLDRCMARIEALRLAMADIAVPEGDRKTLAVQMRSFAALEHLARMVGDMRLARTAPLNSQEWGALHEYRERALQAMNLTAEWLKHPNEPAPLEALRTISHALTEQRHRERRTAVERAAEAQVSPEVAMAELEVLRQIDRMARHAEKVADYLGSKSETAAPASEAAADEHSLNA